MCQASSHLNFTRARGVLAGSSSMTRRARSAVAGFVALFVCSAAWAQPDSFGSLYSAVPRLASLALSNNASFHFATSFDWIGSTTPDFLPPLEGTSPVRRPKASGNVGSADFSKDSSKDVVEMKRTNFFDYATGEVGFLYGRSTGKYGIESERGYIIGEVGNEHLHISAGASYENVNGRLPRFVR